MRGIASFVRSIVPRFVDLPEPPQPAAGQVLCRTLELGICGTDRDILSSGQPWTAPRSEFLVLGHECVARIESVGAGVDDLRVGDLVVPLVRRPLPLTAPVNARHAAAVRRRTDLLPLGQYVERGIVAEHGFSLPYWVDEPRHLIPIEPAFRPLAVFTEPQSVAEKAVNEALRLQQARLGHEAWTDVPPRVLVTGLGPIAFAAIIAAASRRWPTTVAGRDKPGSPRVEAAAALGADYRPLGGAGEAAEIDAERDGFDLVLECTGSEDVVLQAAQWMASCAVMAWLGSSRVQQPGDMNVARLVRDGLVRNHLYLGSVNAAVRDFHDAMAHLRLLQATNPRAVEAVVTARIGPDDALWHFEHRQPQGIKTVVVYE